MREKIYIILAMFISCMISACAGSLDHHSLAFISNSNSLNTWVDQSLIPYLTEQISLHPKFKGEPFLIVSMKEDDIRPEINDLTRQIRNRIKDALITKPGVNLVWRPSVKPWGHQRRLGDVECDEGRKINFYLGIDTGFTPVDNMLYVKIRALDMVEKKWTDGFGRSWEGLPTKKQKEAMGRVKMDEYLRGLRPLPFTQKHPDLVAAYLAHNLSCIFRQIETDEIKVYIEQPTGQIAFFQSTVKLVKKYIAKFREIKITDDRSKANVIASPEIETIYNNLYQIWVTVKDKKGQEYLGGAEAETYVILDDIDHNRVTTVQGDGQRVSGPVQSVQHPVQDLPAIPEASAPEISPVIHIISDFQLLCPIIQKFCGTTTPWVSGEREIMANETLPPGSCMAVKVILERPSHLFVVGYDESGGFSKLFPSHSGELSQKIDSDDIFRFPSNDNVLDIYGQSQREWVYVIAITDTQLAFDVDKTLSRMVYGDIVKWEDYLNQLQSASGGKAQWQVKSLQHDL